MKFALARSGIDDAVVTPHASALATLMSRRHQIVHRTDRKDLGRSGDHAAAALGVATVEAWIRTVDALCRAIVAEL